MHTKTLSTFQVGNLKRTNKNRSKIRRSLNRAPRSLKAVFVDSDAFDPESIQLVREKYNGSTAPHPLDQIKVYQWQEKVVENDDPTVLVEVDGQEGSISTRTHSLGPRYIPVPASDDCLQQSWVKSAINAFREAVDCDIQFTSKPIDEEVEGSHTIGIPRAV